MGYGKHVIRFTNQRRHHAPHAGQRQYGGRTAQTTGQIDYWTRSDLAKKANLDIEDDLTKWTAYAHSITGDDYTSLVKQLGKTQPPLRRQNYVKATFSEDGVYQGGDTAGNNKGDTLYVVGERPGNRHPHQPERHGQHRVEDHLRFGQGAASRRLDDKRDRQDRQQQHRRRLSDRLPHQGHTAQGSDLHGRLIDRRRRIQGH